MFHGLVTKISTLPFRFAIMVRFQMRVAVRSKVVGIHFGARGSCVSILSTTTDGCYLLVEVGSGFWVQVRVASRVRGQSRGHR